jgi:hypothetical protein
MPYGKRSSRQRPHDAAYSSRAPASKESARALAARYGLNAKTVRKWRKRTAAADEPTGPKTPQSTVPTPAEEAIVVAFRQKTLLPLDDVLGCLKDAIPNLSRSALHRCLQRHRVSGFPSRRHRSAARGSRPTRSATSTSTVANPISGHLRSLDQRPINLQG